VFPSHVTLCRRPASLFSGFPEPGFPGFLRYYQGATTSSPPPPPSRSCSTVASCLRRRCSFVGHSRHAPDAWMLFSRYHPGSGFMLRQPQRGSPVFPANPCGYALFSDPGGTSASGLPRCSGIVPPSTKWWDFRNIGYFGALSQGFPTRCVRFVPASPLTTQHSLAVDGQSFPRRRLSRLGLSSSFQLPFSTSLNSELFTARLS
jgi:hypothetical protein